MRRPELLLLLLLTLALPTVHADDDTPAKTEKTIKVKKTTDIVYHAGEDVHERHKLDLYAPQGVTNAPVLIFIHGGGWKRGNKNIYGYLANSFASQGILVATINYRLSPAVKHPGHIVDTARAFAWIHQNVSKYGGDPKNIFLSGHSAGGHLTALLSTSPKYLAKHGLKTTDIRGAIPISGVFKIEGRYFDRSFPEATRSEASPMNNVGDKQPPFLVIWGEKESRFLGPQARAFAKALEAKKSSVAQLEVKGRNHISIIMFAAARTDAANKAIVKFIKTHTTKTPTTEKTESSK